MKYNCPLCGKPVSPSLYQKIMGIWTEKQKALAKIEQQRARLLSKIGEMRKRLRKEAARFRTQKAHLIRQAVKRRTKRLESQITILHRREREIESQTHEKIRRASALAHKQAQKLADRRFTSFRKQQRASIRAQLRRERERAVENVQRKNQRLEKTFRNTLTQMRIKDRQLQDQSKQIKELERQLEKHTTAQLEGYLDEHTLARDLKRRFPEDEIRHTGKGGDVIHRVMQKGQQAGTIVYECKRVKHYLASHVKQAARAKEKMKADFAILVTNAMKKNTQGFFTEGVVLVVHQAGVLYLTSVLREQTIQIAELKLGQSQRNKAVRLTLEYLQGPEFSNSLNAIMQETTATYNELKDEVRKHVASWKKRLALYRKIYEEALTVKSTTKTLLSGQPEYKKLIPTETLPALPELPQLEKSVASPEQTQNADPGEHRPNNTKKHLNTDSRTPA
jgi:hypothetical protein